MNQRLLFVIVFTLFSGAAASATEPSTSGLLRLAGGDYVPGRLADSTSPPDLDTASKRLAWRHPDFCEPFEFNLNAVLGASFPPPELSSPASGQFVVELRRGDRVFGSIVRIDAETIRASTEQFGELSIDRAAVRRISTWNDGRSVLFTGPGSVLDWKVLPDQQAWPSGGNQLHTDRPAATAFRDLGLPDKARIEIELTWEGTPNFVFAIGVDAKNSDYGASSAFRLEVWDDQIALVRELDQTADCVPLGKWKDLSGALRLTFEIDQVRGRIVALSPQSEVLGEISVAGEGYPGVRPGVRLTNLQGNVSLETIRVLQLTSRTAQKLSTDHDHDLDLALLDDESSFQSNWTEVTSEGWVLVNGDIQRTVDPQHIESIELQLVDVNADDEKNDARNLANEQDDQSSVQSSAVVQVITHGGVRISGEIQSAHDGRVTIVSNAIAEPVSIANADISRITVTNPEPLAAESSVFILGRLEFAGGRLTGRLIDTDSESQPTPLRFAPRHASPVNLEPTFTGRMVYRESPPPETPEQRRVREQRDKAVKLANERRANQPGVLNILARAFGNRNAHKPAESSPRSMHLRSGEIIPCEVTSIDEHGVVFTSDVTEKTRLPQDQIRSIAFTAGCRDPEIEATRRDRLLTVPRIRKNNPPTHLIVAVNGDVMRGRLVRTTADTIEVETRLETIPIPRSVVAQIIWLDEQTDDSDDDDGKMKNASPDDPRAGDIAVRALLQNGNCMSLFARNISGSVLIGEHPLLGKSNIKLGDVNELLIGIDINRPHPGQPYGDWMLKDAAEPIVAEEGAEGGAAALSPLVGIDAPDFSLDLLDGGAFSISSSRGKVLVLDFWATWCGPCLQAMPVIEETVAQFDENDVRLVAVNLQETVGPITETLERLKISPEVALDIDGVAAARYQADAIPQTVVINRAGKITHVFIGGGPKLGEQLRAAIAATLGEQ